MGDRARRERRRIRGRRDRVSGDFDRRLLADLNINVNLGGTSGIAEMPIAILSADGAVHYAGDTYGDG